MVFNIYYLDFVGFVDFIDFVGFYFKTVAHPESEI